MAINHRKKYQSQFVLIKVKANEYQQYMWTPPFKFLYIYICVPIPVSYHTYSWLVVQCIECVYPEYTITDIRARLPKLISYKLIMVLTFLLYFSLLILTAIIMTFKNIKAYSSHAFTILHVRFQQLTMQTDWKGIAR